MEKTDKQKRSKKWLQAFGISALMIFWVVTTASVNLKRRPFTIDDYFFEDMFAHTLFMLIFSLIVSTFLNKKYSTADVFGGSAILYALIVQLIAYYN